MTGRKNGLKVTLLIGFFIAALTVGLFPYIKENQASKPYEEPQTGQSSSRTNSIEGLIISAAGFYFKANANIQQLLYIVEMQDSSGIKAEVMEPILEATITGVQKAANAYYQLLLKALYTPYNYDVLELLKKFPYDDYRLENGLNQTVMDEVEQYLRNGNVTGIFKRSFNRLNQAGELLNNFKGVVYSDKDAAITIAWQLNEIFSDMSLFGSYVARVLRSI